jgi:hypothetical protein
MSETNNPVSESPTMGFPPKNATLTPWAEAEAGLQAVKTYWLATVRPEGRPHVMPVWGVWLEERFFFSTAAASRKGKNLAANPYCTIVLSHNGLDIAVEGTAAIVMDDATAQRVADVYAPKYDWPLTVRDGGLYGENGDGGPLYVVTPSVAFGFGEASGFTATRWRFGVAE